MILLLSCPPKDTQSIRSNSLVRGKVFLAEDEKSLGRFCKAAVASSNEVEQVNRSGERTRTLANDDMTIIISSELDFFVEAEPYRLIAKSLGLACESKTYIDGDFVTIDWV